MMNAQSFRILICCLFHLTVLLYDSTSVDSVTFCSEFLPPFLIRLGKLIKICMQMNLTNDDRKLCIEFVILLRLFLNVVIHILTLLDVAHLFFKTVYYFTSSFLFCLSVISL